MARCSNSGLPSLVRAMRAAHGMITALLRSRSCPSSAWECAVRLCRPAFSSPVTSPSCWARRSALFPPWAAPVNTAPPAPSAGRRRRCIPRRISASGVFSTGVRRFILASVIRRPRHQGWLSQTRHSPEGRSMATGISPPATALLTARRWDEGSIELHHHQARSPPRFCSRSASCADGRDSARAE